MKEKQKNKESLDLLKASQNITKQVNYVTLHNIACISLISCSPFSLTEIKYHYRLFANSNWLILSSAVDDN